MNPCQPFATKNRSPWRGFIAKRTSGARTIQEIPRTAIVENQTRVTGPKTFPIPAVPRLCIEKIPTSIAMVIGRMNGSKRGVATSNPSIADRTAIEGAIIPSP
jgi:hypothetical protein